MALVIPLACASCSSKPESWPTQPVPAVLTLPQAATLAQQYLDQHSVTAFITGELNMADGWWLQYRTPFDPSATPPSSSYLLMVHDDGTVTEFH
jgi:hypothetical protein